MKLLLAAFLTLKVAFVVVDAQTGNRIVDNGIAAGTQLTVAIGNKDFANTLGKLATKVAPYLGMVGPFIGIIASISGTYADSAEMIYMREKFSQMNTRFDQIDLKLNEISSKIDRAVRDIQFHRYESNIRAAKLKLNKIFKAKTTTEYESSKTEFTAFYQYVYAESTPLLYSHIVGSTTFSSESILSSAVRASDHDRRKLQAFMLDLTKLILTGSQIEIAYYKIKYPGWVRSEEQKWINNIKRMGRDMEAVDEDIAGNFLTAATNDAKNILAIYRYTGYSNSRLSNYRMSDKVYDMLTTKYYWRNWFLVIYDDIRGRDVHWISLCSGNYVFRESSYNMLLASNPKETPTIAISWAFSYLESAKYLDTDFWSPNTYLDADEVMESIEVPDSCSLKTAYGVIESSADVSLRANYWRYVDITRGPYWLFMFR